MTSPRVGDDPELRPDGAREAVEGMRVVAHAVDQDQVRSSPAPGEILEPGTGHGDEPAGVRGWVGPGWGCLPSFRPVAWETNSRRD